MVIHALAEVCFIEKPMQAFGWMFCMFMMIVDNVAGTEDDEVAVEFEEMRIMAPCADGDGR